MNLKSTIDSRSVRCASRASPRIAFVVFTLALIAIAPSCRTRATEPTPREPLLFGLTLLDRGRPPLRTIGRAFAPGRRWSAELESESTTHVARERENGVRSGGYLRATIDFVARHNEERTNIEIAFSIRDVRSSLLIDGPEFGKTGLARLGDWSQAWFVTVDGILDASTRQTQSRVWSIDVENWTRGALPPRPTEPLGVGARWEWSYQTGIGWDRISETRTFEVLSFGENEVTLSMNGRKHLEALSGERASSESRGTITFSLDDPTNLRFDAHANGTFQMNGGVRGEDESVFEIRPIGSPRLPPSDWIESRDARARWSVRAPCAIAEVPGIARDQREQGWIGRQTPSGPFWKIRFEPLTCAPANEAAARRLLETRADTARASVGPTEYLRTRANHEGRPALDVRYETNIVGARASALHREIVTRGRIWVLEVTTVDEPIPLRADRFLESLHLESAAEGAAPRTPCTP